MQPIHIYQHQFAKNEAKTMNVFHFDRFDERFFPLPLYP